MPLVNLPCDEALVCDETLACQQGISVTAVTPGGLLLTPVPMTGGLYPGFYPGGSSYPGGGHDLVATPVTPQALTLVPA